MDEKTAGRTVDLPASRAFVVQLAVPAGDGNLFRGRIEHLASGSVTHFESLTQLGEFIVRLLAPASGAERRDPARPHDRRKDSRHQEDSITTRRRGSHAGQHGPRWVHRG